MTNFSSYMQVMGVILWKAMKLLEFALEYIFLVIRLTYRRVLVTLCVMKTEGCMQ